MTLEKYKNKVLFDKDEFKKVLESEMKTRHSISIADIETMLELITESYRPTLDFSNWIMSLGEKNHNPFSQKQFNYPKAEEILYELGKL